MTDLNKISSSVYLVFFIVLAILLRFLSFRFSVSDHDESTYLVIAQELLKGKLLYLDVWDTKPVGIFLVFALALKVFGSSIVTIRLIAALVIGLTAHLLFLCIKRWGRQTSHAFPAAVAYIMMCAMHKWVFSANAEIFNNLMTVTALFFFLGKKTGINFFLAGLAIGLGFVTKYFILFDMLAFWLFYLVSLNKFHPKQRTLYLIKNSCFMGFGFIIPLLAVFSYFSLTDRFHELWFATFILPIKYPSGFNLLAALNFFAGFHLIYAPFVIIAYPALFRSKEKELSRFGILWMTLVWIIILLPGKFYFHYYFQLLLPFAFTIPGILGSGSRLERFILKYRKTLLIIGISGFLAWNVTLQYSHFISKPDINREIAHYLKGQMTADEVLYCNQNTVLYFLLGKSPPGKYVHPTLTVDLDHIQAIGLDSQAEFQKIIDKQPDFLVIKDNPHFLLQDYINSHCSLIKTGWEQTRIYARNE